MTKQFIETYKNHPSIVTLKRNALSNSLSFDLPPASQEDIFKIVKSLSASKATWHDEIPLKLTKLSGINNIVFGYVQLQAFTKYLRLTLVFMRNSAILEKSNFCFSRVFC